MGFPPAHLIAFLLGETGDEGLKMLKRQHLSGSPVPSESPSEATKEQGLRKGELAVARALGKAIGKDVSAKSFFDSRLTYINSPIISSLLHSPLNMR